MTQEALVLQATPVITLGYVMQVILSLLVVLGIIFVAGKYLLPRLKGGSAGRLIKVLDRIYLDPQISAFILKVGKSAYLLAASKQQIVKIDKLDEESLAE